MQRCCLLKCDNRLQANAPLRTQPREGIKNLTRLGFFQGEYHRLEGAAGCVLNTESHCEPLRLSPASQTRR